MNQQIQNLIIVPKFVKPTNKKTLSKNFGTSEITSTMSPPSLNIDNIFKGSKPSKPYLTVNNSQSIDPNSPSTIFKLDSMM